jgi:hypothetical protein
MWTTLSALATEKQNYTGTYIAQVIELVGRHLGSPGLQSVDRETHEIAADCAKSDRQTDLF